MKSDITKLAAAAVIIIAVIIIVNQFGGSVDPASVAFAKATEALKKVSWIHIIDPDYEEWTNYDLQIHTTLKSDGRVVFADYRQGKQYEYNPEIDSVYIYRIEGNLDEGESPILWEEQLEVFEKIKPDGVISCYRSWLDGKNVNTYTLSWVTNNGVRCQSEVTVDVGTDLPLLAILKTLRHDGTVVTESEGIFEYPQDGPSTIYDVRVPRDAKILDYTSGNLADTLKDSLERLRLLGLSLHMYADNDRGMLPDTLQDLESYIDNLQWYLDNIEYIGKGKALRDSGSLIAYDKSILSENGQRTTFLFDDGHVEFGDIKYYLK